MRPCAPHNKTHRTVPAILGIFSFCISYHAPVTVLASIPNKTRTLPRYNDGFFHGRVQEPHLRGYGYIVGARHPECTEYTLPSGACMAPHHVVHAWLHTMHGSTLYGSLWHYMMFMAFYSTVFHSAGCMVLLLITYLSALYVATIHSVATALNGAA